MWTLLRPPDVKDMDKFNDIEILIDSRYPVICIETSEEERAEQTLDRLCMRMNLPFFNWAATSGLSRSGEPQPAYNTGTAMEALNFIASSSIDAVYLMKDLHRFLDDPLLVRKLRDICRCFRQKRKSLVLTAPSFSIPPELSNEVVFFDLALPSVEELTELVRKVVREVSSYRKICVDMDQQTGWMLVQNLKGLTLNEAERLLTRAILHDDRLTCEDLPLILEAKKERIAQSGLLEFIPAGEKFEGIGGLQNLKRWLTVRKGAFSKEAKKFGIDPPRGILLLGVQGCGKSFTAKAIAREWLLPLLRLDTGALYSKYVGETEANMRDTIRLAESLAPIVLWIDEIEKAFTPSGNTGADGGVSSRLLGTFLSWLQEKKAPVFVTATANDITGLPPELLRKGRFDEVFFLDLPASEERSEIFRLHLESRKRDPAGFDLRALAEAADGCSGAEIEQAIVSALYSAFSARKELSTEGLLQELRTTRPLSLVMKEDIDGLRQWAHGRTVPAS
jgi:ATP-dependent 26S proteasome regulatory subunit